jgi:hypothetical protein
VGLPLSDLRTAIPHGLPALSVLLAPAYNAFHSSTRLITTTRSKGLPEALISLVGLWILLLWMVALFSIGKREAAHLWKIQTDHYAAEPVKPFARRKNRVKYAAAEYRSQGLDGVPGRGMKKENECLRPEPRARKVKRWNSA